MSNYLEQDYQYPREKTPTAVYFLGLLCLIPLLGALVGLILLIIGISKYKDKWLAVIGIFGILFTVAVYAGLFYFLKHSDIPKQGLSLAAQIQLNKLMQSVEFYKLEHGSYPESLMELKKSDKTAEVFDPINVFSNMKEAYFNYENLQEHYRLFSSGPDGIPNTADDLYPEIAHNSKQIGWIK